MNPRVLSSEAWKIVRRLVASGCLEAWTLAGGTGLALQLGHRYSEDLDFFGVEDFETEPLIQRLSDIGPLSIQSRSSRTLHVMLDSLRVSDTLAQGITYVEASTEPQAIWDPNTRRLTWLLSDPPADQPVHLRYRVRPSGIGSWRPLSVIATARYEVEGEIGEVGFPTPTVQLRGPGRALLPGLWGGQHD